MRNPFEIPQSLTQWLFSSGAWTGSCLIGFLLFCHGIDLVWPSDSSFFLILGAAGCICVLMWRQAITLGWRLWSDNKDGGVLNMVAFLWLLVLSGVFVVSVLSIAFGTFMWLAISNEPASTSGSGWMD
jgi:hypothetical protein